MLIFPAPSAGKFKSENLLPIGNGNCNFVENDRWGPSIEPNGTKISFPFGKVMSIALRSVPFRRKRQRNRASSVLQPPSTTSQTKSALNRHLLQQIFMYHAWRR
uniref:Uncharacterized protein n=1 Tax=Romanomermis culicivorax TaxID=13658 RepID=A0A915I8X9_ROMCU